MKYINANAETDKQKEYSKVKYGKHGSDRKSGNSIKGESQHLTQRVFGLSCLTFTDDIIHGGGLQSYHRDETAQIQIFLFILTQHIERPFAHQSEVGMIIHALHSHLRLQLIECLGRHPFHERVGL